MFAQILPSIYRWAIYAALGTAILAVVAGKAYLAGDDHGQGLVRAADAKTQAAVYRRFEWNVNNGVKLAAELATDKAKAAPVETKDNKEIARDTHPTVAAPGAATSAPVLTARAVCLFDRKWSGFQLPGGYRAAGADGGAGDACADAQGASAFDIVDALYSDALNADICWSNTLQLQKLIQWERDRAAHAGKR